MQQTSNQSAGPPAPPPYLPLLLFLFLGSGCAALIYEIVWLQLLQLVIGASAVSLGMLLGAFMGGMCLGSLALARIIPEGCHPLRVYGLLETGMAIVGLTVLFAVPVIGRLYAPHAGPGFAGLVLRGIVAAVCLLPPTILMGATLPAISRWVQSTAHGMAWLGLFYAGNTAGAVLGCLLAGFYLLRKYDMATATCVAAAINASAAAVAFGLASQTRGRTPTEEERGATPQPVAGANWVYATIGLSGLCALGAEVIWTRLLSLMLGATVYTFSIILAVFLAGLGLGSAGGSLLARNCAHPRIALGWCQMLVAAAMGWAALMLTTSLPYWPVVPYLSTSPWYTFQLDLVHCLWALLPATILWGASFPLALACVAAPGQDAGRLVGRVYAANTVGAIIGALGASLVMIAWVGTQQTQRVLIGLSTVSGLIMLRSSFSARKDAAVSDNGSAPMPKILSVPSLVIALGMAIFLVVTVPPIPWKLVALGRYLVVYGDNRTKLYMGEGINASVAVTKMNDTGARNFHVSGRVEASTEPQDMRLQRMLGHLPALIHPHPRSILVVGCGAGITAGTFTTYPEITNIVICEIEPLIPAAVATYFAKENYDVVHDSRVKIVFDDARHYVLTTPEKFDIITSDPIHPWVKGAATLYTTDYFELCKEHLNSGGLVTQWVPLYESDVSTVKSELATFFDVFPNGTLWINDFKGRYDVVLVGCVDALRINLDTMEERFEGEGTVGQSLSDGGFPTIVALLATYGGRAADLKPWMADAQINRDTNLRLQYLAGLASDFSHPALISDDIRAYRKFPEGIFSGSEERKATIRAVLELKQGKERRTERLERP